MLILMYSFPNLNQSIFPCPILTVASWPLYRFLRKLYLQQYRKVRNEKQQFATLSDISIISLLCSVFWMLSFKPAFPLSSFTFIKRLFSSPSLSAIRVVSSDYLWLLLFLPAILIPACDSSSSAFHMMHSSIWASLVAQLVKKTPPWGRLGFNSWVGKIPWGRERQPTPVFWPGESFCI